MQPLRILLSAVVLSVGVASPGCSRAARAQAPIAAESRETPPGTQLGQARVFPGEGARLQQPAGFELAQRFAGFEQPSSGAFVMVMGLDTPYDPNFLSEETWSSSEVAARTGLTYLGRELVQVGPHAGVLLRAHQSSQGLEIAKWSLYIGDESRSVQVTAGCAAADADSFEALFRATLLSTRLDDTPPPTMTELLGFSIEPSGGLELMEVNATTAMYADQPLPAAPGASLFIATRSVSTVSIPDLPAYATARLRSLPGCTEATITASTPVTIDGLAGHELEASATRGGVPSLIHLVMLPVDGGYIVMVGMAELARADELRPIFHAMARSLRRAETAN